MGLFSKKKKNKAKRTTPTSKVTTKSASKVTSKPTSQVKSKQTTAPTKTKEESKQKTNKANADAVTEEASAETKSRKDVLLENWAANRSEKIPIGRSFQTRDEYIEGGIAKEDADEESFYRRVFAIETNELNELAVIKSTTSPKGTIIPDYDGKSRTRPYVYTKDDEGKPIKKGKKYIENPPSKDIKPEVAEKLLKEAIKYPNSYKNVTEMKKRKEEKRQE